jgi:hypothetical protein
LQDDADAKVNRAVVAFQGGLCSLGTAQGIAGLPVTDEDDEVWYAAPAKDDPAAEDDPADPEDSRDPADDPEENDQAEAA